MNPRRTSAGLRFNSFSPGQKAIHVGITLGFMKAPGFRPSLTSYCWLHYLVTEWIKIMLPCIYNEPLPLIHTPTPPAVAAAAAIIPLHQPRQAMGLVPSTSIP
jgi:hypothetical protein